MATALTPLPRLERWFPSVTPGVRLCCVEWQRGGGASAPASSPAGAILFCHGYAHYCAPVYDWLATVLWSRARIACFAVEHAGHGKSDGLRAYIPSFAALVDDVLRFSTAVRGRLLPAGTPLFLYGESLGGAIAQHAALRAPRAFSGLCLLAPMTGLAEGMEPHALVVALGRAAAWLAPTAPLAPVADIVPKCFRNPAVVEAARADPFRYAGRLRLGTAFELKAAMQALADGGARLDTPAVVFHGTADAVTSHAASERFVAAAAARDMTLFSYEGGWHVLWAEPADTRARLLADLVEWLGARCDPERRAALARAHAAAAPAAAPVYTRPFGVASWGGDPADETTAFTLATHRHLYEGTKPDGELAPLPDDEHAAMLQTMPPRAL